MKKFLWLSIFLFGLASSVHAISPRDEDDNRILHYSTTSVQSSTQIVMLDLSDTTTFLHDHTGYFSISRIKASLDLAASAAGTLKIGVVSYINTSTGTLTYFFECPFINHGATADVITCDESYSPSFIRADTVDVDDVGDASTPYIVGTSSAALAAIQSDTEIGDSQGGETTPDFGDIVMTVTRNDANAAAVVVDIFYHSKR